MTKQTFPAKVEALSDVLGFVDRMLELYECPMKIQTAICVAIEEVFVNVAHYAYAGGEGDVTLGIGFDADSGEEYGTLTDVIQTGANDVYHIKPAEGKLLLAPAIDEVVKSVDIDGGVMEIIPLAGLFDDED